MLSITDAKKTLEALGLEKEVVNKFVELSEPHIEFHKYIMKKHDISSEKCETLIKELSQNYIKNNSTDNMSQEDLFGLAGKAIEEYAINEGYDALLSEKLRTSIYDIAILFTSL